MPASADISVLVPVHNEEGSLPAFLGRLAPVLSGWPGRAEVIFVDDASRDGSAAILEEFCAVFPGACLLRHAVNRGRGNAVMTGIGMARGEILVTIDADLENPPEAIPLLLAEMGPAVSCVTGFRKGRSRRDPRGRASWVFNHVMAWLTGLPLHDFNCGLKAFRGHALRQPDVFSWLEKDGDYFRFVIYLLNRLACRATEYAIPVEPRRHGRSRYSWKRYGKAGRDLLKLLDADLSSGLLRRRRRG